MQTRLRLKHAPAFAGKVQVHNENIALCLYAKDPVGRGRHEVGGGGQPGSGRREVEQNTSREGAMRNIGEFTRCCLDGILIKIG